MENILNFLHQIDTDAFVVGAFFILCSMLLLTYCLCMATDLIKEHTTRESTPTVTDEVYDWATHGW